MIEYTQKKTGNSSVRVASRRKIVDMSHFAPLQRKSAATISSSPRAHAQPSKTLPPISDPSAPGSQHVSQQGGVAYSLAQIAIATPSQNLRGNITGGGASSPIQRMVIKGKEQATVKDVQDFAFKNRFALKLGGPEIQDELNKEIPNPNIQIGTFLFRLGVPRLPPVALSTFTPPPPGGSRFTPAPNPGVVTALPGSLPPAKKLRPDPSGLYGGSVSPTSVPTRAPIQLTADQIDQLIEANRPVRGEKETLYYERLEKMVTTQFGEAAWQSKRLEILSVAKTALEVTQLDSAYRAAEEMRRIQQSGELSDEELSETEVEVSGGGGFHKTYKIIQVRTYRDALKALRTLKKSGTARIYIRIGVGGPVFEVQRKGSTNVYLSPIDPQEELVGNRLPDYKESMRKLTKQGRPGEGYVKKHSTTYGNLGKTLAKYPPQEIASAIHDKFAKKTPYPAKFSPQETETMDELFALLFIVEVYRTGFAGPLGIASVQALLKGTSIEDVLYKGEGQSEALHVGTSQKSQGPKIGGQEAEQTVGTGSVKGLKNEAFNKALQRTLNLFARATGSNSPESFEALLQGHLELIRAQKK